MPLYEYECGKCGEKIEVIRSFSDPPLTVCPNCGGELKKLLSSPAFQFKGSGFYLTDYGKSGSSQAGEKEKKSAGKAEEGKSASESSGGEATGGESKKEESSKGKKDGGSDAAPSSPAAPPSPAPSKKNPKGDTK